MKKIIITLFLSISLLIGYSQSLPNVATPSHSSSTSTAYVFNVSGYGTAYNDKICFLKFLIDNTGPSTVNINGIGTKQLRIKSSGVWRSLIAGDLQDSVRCFVAYDQASGYMRVVDMFREGGGSGGWAVTGTTNLTGDVTINGGGNNLTFSNIDALHFNAGSEAHLLSSGDLNLVGIDALLEGTTSNLIKSDNLATIQVNGVNAVQVSPSATTITTPSLKLVTTPTRDDSLTQILARDFDDGEVNYIKSSTLGKTANPLSQFASTTSAQLAGVLSDESGSSGGFTRADYITLNNALSTDPSANNINITDLADGVDPQDAVNKRQLDAVTEGINLQPLNEQTGSNYTFALSDAGKIVDRNVGTANTATIPPNSSVSFSLGTYLCICEKGAGISSFAEGSGVTITPQAGTGNLNSLGKNNGIGVPTCARKIATNTWELLNGLPAATVRANIFANNFYPTINKGSTRNRWYGSGIFCGSTLSQVVAANTMYASPLIISERITIDQIQTEVTTAVASTNFRIGIYADDGTGYPGSLLYGTAALSSATTGVKNEALSSTITVNPGLYWLAILSDGAPTFRSWSLDAVLNILGYPSTMGLSQAGSMWSVSQSYGALPSTFTAGGTVQLFKPHMILYRAQ